MKGRQQDSVFKTRYSALGTQEMRNGLAFGGIATSETSHFTQANMVRLFSSYFCQRPTLADHF